MDISELVLAVRNTDDAVRQINKVTNALNNTQKTATTIGKGLFAGWTFTKVIRGVKVLGDSFRDVLVTFRSFNTLYGQINNQATSSVRLLQNSFQQTEKSAKKLLNLIGSRTIEFGFDTKTFTKVNTDLAKISKQISSFYNIDDAQVSQKLTNAMYGMTKGLREFGVNIDTTTPKFKQMIQQMRLATGETEQGAKALVIYNQILKQSKKFEGSFQTQAKSLSQAFANISNTLSSGVFAKAGQVLSSIFVPILEKINNILSEPWVQKIGGIVLALGAVLAAIMSIQVAIGGVKSMLLKLAGSGGAGGIVTSIATKIMTALKGLLVKIIAVIGTIVSGVVTFIAGLPTLAIAAIVAVLAAGVSLLINKLTTGQWFNYSGMVNAVIGWFKRFGQRIKNWWSGDGFNLDSEILKKQYEKINADIASLKDARNAVGDSLENWNRETNDDEYNLKQIQEKIEKITSRNDQINARLTILKGMYQRQGRQLSSIKTDLSVLEKEYNTAFKVAIKTLQGSEKYIKASEEERRKMLEAEETQFLSIEKNKKLYDIIIGLKENEKQTYKKYAENSEEILSLTKQYTNNKTLLVQLSGKETELLAEQKKQQQQKQRLQKQVYNKQKATTKFFYNLKSWYMDLTTSIKQIAGIDVKQIKIGNIRIKIQELNQSLNSLTGIDKIDSLKQIAQLEKQKFQIQMDNINKQKNMLEQINNFTMNLIDKLTQRTPQGVSAIESGTSQAVKFMTTNSSMDNSQAISLLTKTQNQTITLSRKQNQLVDKTNKILQGINGQITNITKQTGFTVVN